MLDKLSRCGVCAAQLISAVQAVFGLVTAPIERNAFVALAAEASAVHGAAHLVRRVATVCLTVAQPDLWDAITAVVTIELFDRTLLGFASSSWVRAKELVKHRDYRKQKRAEETRGETTYENITFRKINKNI